MLTFLFISFLFTCVSSHINYLPNYSCTNTNNIDYYGYEKFSFPQLQNWTKISTTGSCVQLCEPYEKYGNVRVGYYKTCKNTKYLIHEYRGLKYNRNYIPKCLKKRNHIE